MNPSWYCYYCKKITNHGTVKVLASWICLRCNNRSGTAPEYRVGGQDFPFIKVKVKEVIGNGGS